MKVLACELYIFSVKKTEQKSDKLSIMVLKQIRKQDTNNKSPCCCQHGFVAILNQDLYVLLF